MKGTILSVILFLGSPITLVSALWLKFVRRDAGGGMTDWILMRVGVLAVPDQYYQPLINPWKHLKKSLREDRNLPDLDFNTSEQLSLLASFHYNDELLRFPVEKRNDLEFYYNNPSYDSGDAEYLYNVVRHIKPRRIVEVGCGYSSLMIQNAIAKNKEEDSGYACRHICIEPYEQPWLEKLNIELYRCKVECAEASIFEVLQAGDLLFIDSSHVMRPQGDVLFLYQEVLPALASGVWVHIHDIFTPRDYLDDWVFKRHHLWNEQYLLESFLTFNSQFKVVGALNYLSHHHYKELAEKCPIFAVQEGREPGSFWIVRK
jgi:hypothetical protein